MLCLQISDLLHAMQATVTRVLLIDAKEHVKALTQSTTQFTIVQTTHNGEVESPVFKKVWCDAVSM
jgi:hypothetical protein